MATHLSGLAHSLTRMVSGQALPPLSHDRTALGLDAAGEADESSGEQQSRRASEWCVQNEQGGYTFKEEDENGLSLAKAVQAAGEAVAGVAELYDEQARTSLLPVQELLREAAYPHAQNAVSFRSNCTASRLELIICRPSQALLATHRQLLAFQAQLAALPSTNATAEALARSDTLLNLTSAELERAHTERQADIRHATEALLDAQISLHRRALDELEFARSHFDAGAFEALAQTGPRLRSKLEGDTSAVGARAALVMPSSYGMPKGLLGRRLTDGFGTALFGARGGPSGAVANGAAPAPTAGTMRQPSVAEILAAQERGEVVGWRGSFLDNGTTYGGAGWM